MSRSFRKTPIASITTAVSEKEEKRLLNRRVRRINRQRVRIGKDPFDRRLLYNPWLMAKDGKLRFDPRDWPAGMRK